MLKISNFDENPDQILNKWNKVDSEGWGSNVRAVFDDEGKLLRMEREISDDDKEFKVSYLSYLENQLDE